MIQVSALYPNGDGKHFDMAYYNTRHVALVQSKVGAALKGCTVTGGLGGGTPGSPPPFLAIASYLFDSVEAFQAAFGPHTGEVLSDVPNYTNCDIVLQVSQVTLQA